MFWQWWETKFSKAHVHHNSLCSKPLYVLPYPQNIMRTHEHGTWGPPRLSSVSCHSHLTLGTILLLYFPCPPNFFLPYPECILYFFLTARPQHKLFLYRRMLFLLYLTTKSHKLIVTGSCFVSPAKWAILLLVTLFSFLWGTPQSFMCSWLNCQS